MVRLIGALMLVLVVVSPSFGQQSLVGTYKLVSSVVEVDGTPNQIWGKAPHGYLVFTPTRFITFVQQTIENLVPLWLRRQHSWTRWQVMQARTVSKEIN